VFVVVLRAFINNPPLLMINDEKFESKLRENWVPKNHKNTPPIFSCEIEK
jgi:hypothetical protein